MPVYKKPVKSTDWNPLTEEDAEKMQNDMATYAISKALTEKALWKFAEEHEELNLVTGECLVLRGFDPHGFVSLMLVFLP